MLWVRHRLMNSLHSFDTMGFGGNVTVVDFSIIYSYNRLKIINFNNSFLTHSVSERSLPKNHLEHNNTNRPNIYLGGDGWCVLAIQKAFRW